MDGLIGKTLGYSFSKIIHEYLTHKPYALIESDSLEAALQSKDLKAVNITNPYKQQALTFCTHLDDTAKQTNAVNTMVKTAKGYTGYNTDVKAVEALFLGRFPKTTPVSIIGNGATAKSIATAFKTLGHTRVTLFARNPSGDAKPLDALKNHDNIGILVHATPVGTAPNSDVQPLVDITKLRGVSFVFDVVYNPYRTQLLQAAKHEGIPHMNGLMMLVLQAAIAHEIVSQNALSDTMVKSLYDYVLSLSTTLVLIGMPGVGKSLLANRLAKQQKRPVFDSDLTIEAQSGLSVPSMINRYGLENFRKQENKAVSALSKKQGVIIATGGGVVENQENMRALLANGILVYIDTDTLPSKALLNGSRPLLKDAEAWDALYQHRAPLYKQYADIIVNYHSTNELLQKSCEVNINAYFNTERPQFKLDRNS